MRSQPLLDYVALRLEAQARRAAGERRPWSDNPTVASRHFCCVIRDDDRTSRDARTLIQELPETEKLPVAMWFRLVNRVETLRTLVASGEAPRVAADVLKTLQSLPVVFNTVAYRVQVKGGLWNLPTVAAMIARSAKAVRDDWRPRRSAEITCQALRGAVGHGPFLAYQSMQDIRWVSGPYEDEDTWAMLGGGAIRGIRRLIGEYSPKDYLKVAGGNSPRVREPGYSEQEQIRLLPKLLGLLPALRELEPRFNLFEVEHNLCEYDKWERIRSGETPGRPFSPRSAV